MKKHLIALLCCLLACTVLFACGEPTAEPTQATEPETTEAVTEAPTEPETEPETEAPTDAPAATLADGVYLAKFDTDSSMFHVNEAYNDMGTLIVRDGKMSLRIVLASTKIVELYVGTADEAKAEGAQTAVGTARSVSYSDGSVEEANEFEISVPALDEEFDCALLGSKGKWYDHKVKVSEATAIEPKNLDVTLEGGTGKASVASPARVFVGADGQYLAEVVWSSSKYEQMKLGETVYNVCSTEPGSTFYIPVTVDEDIAVSALTVAMSEPHWIDYTLHFAAENG